MPKRRNSPPTEPTTFYPQPPERPRRRTPTAEQVRLSAAALRRAVAFTNATSDAEPVKEPPKDADARRNAAVPRTIRLPPLWWELFDAKAKELKTPPRKLARRIFAEFLYPKDGLPKMKPTMTHDGLKLVVATSNRPDTGSIEWRSNRWWARISVPGRGRIRIRLLLPSTDGVERDLDKKDEHEPIARKLAAELSVELRAEAVVTPKHQVTVQEFGTEYTSGALYRRNGPVRGLKAKASMKTDINRLRSLVYPYIGHLAVADVTEEDIEQCFSSAIRAQEEKLGRPWRAATVKHFWQLLHRLFDLAIRPGRIRTDNPVSDDLRPRRDAPKLFAYLYPDELVQLIGCEEIPLVRRVGYVLGSYTSLRKASLLSLTWSSLNTERKSIFTKRTKNGLALNFRLADPDLPGLQSAIVMLERYRALVNGKPSDPILQGTGVRGGHEAETLREDLRTAGIRRELLFLREANIEPLRFHDLRATFVTWAFRCGKGDNWISQYTGHLTPEMVQRYQRAALSIDDLDIKPFPDISEAIPELRKSASNVRLLRS